MAKDDISNKSLATLLIVAIVVSVGGTWLVLNKAPSLLTITGLQSSTDTGTALLQINTVASLRFAVDVVNFQNGSVNTSSGNTVCTMDTTGVSLARSQCINFTNVTAGFQIENDGSTNLSVNLSSDKSADTFFGGSASLNEFKWKISQNESSSCLNSTGGSGGTTVTPTAYTDVDTSAGGITVCPFLKFLDASDSIKVDINVTIPYDATSGVKTATLTATGTTV
ncbi:hypothetical protein HY493_05035 [Candidatus Woesearchaeota archaeon]|nr:hypothetical protein [Candidatus Woesearchaeota archaeon]